MWHETSRVSEHLILGLVGNPAGPERPPTFKEEREETLEAPGLQTRSVSKRWRGRAEEGKGRWRTGGKETKRLGAGARRPLIVQGIGHRRE